MTDDGRIRPSASIGRRRSSVVQRAADELRAAIRQGDLPPGQRLVQQDLAVRLGVSRGMLREALGRLAAERLVEPKFNAGFAVRRLSRREVIWIEEARQAIEVAAAGAAAERFPEQGDETDLDFTLEAMSQAAREHARQTFLTLNERFHHIILVASGNPMLLDILNRLQVPTIPHQLERFADPGYMIDSDREHRRIASALKAGDRPAAEREMRLHLERVRSVSAAMPEDRFAPDEHTPVRG